MLFEVLIPLFLTVAPILVFGTLSYCVGGYIERRHFQQLQQRESETAHIVTSQLKSFPGLAPPTQQPPQCLVAEVVISSDYLKTFFGAMRGIFGGEIRSFCTILERARREALLRLKEQAAQQGFNGICNVRLETADIAGRGQKNKNKIVMAAVIASCTAYHAQLPTGAAADVG